MRVLRGKSIVNRKWIGSRKESLRGVWLRPGLHLFSLPRHHQSSCPPPPPPSTKHCLSTRFLELLCGLGVAPVELMSHRKLFTGPGLCICSTLQVLDINAGPSAYMICSLLVVQWWWVTAKLIYVDIKRKKYILIYIFMYISLHTQYIYTYTPIKDQCILTTGLGLFSISKCSSFCFKCGTVLSSRPWEGVGLVSQGIIVFRVTQRRQRLALMGLGKRCCEGQPLSWLWLLAVNSAWLCS